MVGLVVALGLVLLAFEWKSKPAELEVSFLKNYHAVEEEQVAITRPPEIKVIPPKISTVIALVENKDTLKEVIKPDVELDANTSALTEELNKTTLPDDISEEEASRFIMIEELPKFMGGRAEETFKNWIQIQTRYPAKAMENGITGKVFVRFCVNISGDVVNVAILRGVDPLLDQEAVRVISSSPKWTPARNRGKAIMVQYTFPVNFVLQ